MAASRDLDLGAIGARLRAQRDETAARVAGLAARPELGSAQGFGKRIGDGTIEAVSRLTDIGVGRTLEDQLVRIDRALEKLGDGTYGVCDACGADIPARRLEALPESVLCVTCAAAEPSLPPPRRR